MSVTLTCMSWGSEGRPHVSDPHLHMWSAISLFRSFYVLILLIDFLENIFEN